LPMCTTGIPRPWQRQSRSSRLKSACHSPIFIGTKSEQNRIAKTYPSGPACPFILGIGPFGFSFQLCGSPKRSRISNS
jgi:hypothetical protein